MPGIVIPQHEIWVKDNYRDHGPGPGALATIYKDVAFGITSVPNQCTVPFGWSKVIYADCIPKTTVAAILAQFVDAIGCDMVITASASGNYIEFTSGTTIATAATITVEIHGRMDEPVRLT